MSHMLRLAQRFTQQFREDSLFRNAAFIMTSTIVTSLLGFGFWVFIARLYSPANVGIAAALISISILISNFSLLGLNSGLLRFLSKSKTQSGDINAAMIVVSIVAMLAAAVCILVSQIFGVGISWFTTELWRVPIFMVLMAAVSLNTLTDAVFIAHRRAQYHTVVYAAFGATKLIVPLFLVSFGSLGIFLAYILAVFMSLMLSIFFMRRSCGYTIVSLPNWRFISEARRYSTSNFLGTLLAGVPGQVMPLFIIHKFGAAQSAYFALAWTVVNLIYVVPSSIAQSLLAESSHDPHKKSINLFHAIKILTAVLVPVVLLAVIIAPYLLKIFGAQYAHGSTTIFQILALTTFFVSVCSVGNTVLNIERRSSGIVVSQFLVAIVALGSVQFLARYGLVGVGLAIMLGYATSNLVYPYFYFSRRKHTSRKVVDLPQPAVALETVNISSEQ